MTIVIAIDGPAGSGKGTVAKKISSFYNFPHLDSGILYRSVAYLCYLSGQNNFEEKTVLEYAQNLNLDEIDVDKLRTEEIDQISSKISAFSAVREACMQDIQTSDNDKTLVLLTSHFQLLR